MLDIDGILPLINGHQLVIAMHNLDISSQNLHNEINIRPVSDDIGIEINITGAGWQQSTPAAAILKVVDIKSGQISYTLGSHNDRITSLIEIPNSQVVITASLDNSLIAWRLHDNNPLATFTGDSALLSCAIAEDKSTIVVGEQLGHLHFLHFDNLEELNADIEESLNIYIDTIAHEVKNVSSALSLAKGFLAVYGKTISPNSYLNRLKQITISGIESNELNDTLNNEMIQVARAFAITFNEFNDQNIQDSFSLKALARLSHCAPDQLLARDAHAVNALAS